MIRIVKDVDLIKPEFIQDDSFSAIMYRSTIKNGTKIPDKLWKKFGKKTVQSLLPPV